MSQPCVGVVVPCYNQGRFAAECIASLQQQTYPHWKAVLLDDASTDGVSGELCQALQRPRVAVVRFKRNRGRSLIRKEGVRRLGTVAYLLVLDCDDYLSPTYLSLLVAALEATPDAGLAYGTLHYFGDMRTDQKTWPTTPYTPATRFLDNVIPGPGVLFRATALAETAGWRADFTECSGEDYDIWLQVVEHGWRPLWVTAAQYHYRQHSQSFLARTNLDKSIDVQLAILKHHVRAIRRSVGLDRYLDRFLLPPLVEALRIGLWRRAARILALLLRCCPVEAARSLIRYYSNRVYAHCRRRTSPGAPLGSPST
jgi:glycosyltransferase involved in cell wall biosynthesis